MYGAEAVLLSDVTLGSPRIRAYQEEDQDAQWQQDVLYLVEVQCRAVLKAARYQQALRRYHQRHVQPRTIQVGDLVLPQFQSRSGLNKLSPMWEGPFCVMEECRSGVFRLTDKDGMHVPNVWNIDHLHKFYS